METPQTNTAPAPRLDALDNLRAMMMWLGIVLHVGIIHMVGPSPLPWRDDRRTAVADLLVGFIHAFRMPVFFILAGFFVALLLHSRGARGMLVHRLRRLALPFAVFWLPLFAAAVLFALLFVHRMKRGTWGLDPALFPQGPGVPTGPNTMHLWFLWMLLWFSVLVAALHAPLHNLPAVVAMRNALARIGGAWWGAFALALPLAAIGAAYPGGFVAPSGSFLPPLSEWLHNGLFFLFGLCLHAKQETLFADFQRRWPWYAVAGLACFLMAGALIERHAAPAWVAYAYNCASWLWSFALLGLVLRHLRHRQPLLAWLSASSYWVYLVHMPLTIGFGALLFGLPLPALAKMAINIAATTLVCVVTYAWLVRRTWVGTLLNGRITPALSRST